MNDEQIEKYREIIADAPEGATGMALKIDAFDYIKLDMEEGCLLFWWDDGFFLVETSELFEYQSFESLANLRTIISQHDRIADLESLNTHAGLRAMYQKSQARVAELERDKDLNKIRADAVREAAEATNKGDEIGYFTCCFHELLSYAEKLEAKGSE